MDKDTQGLMFSSKSNEWATPQDFYNKLNAEFGFTLDPCATPTTAKCSSYYTADDDGLSKDWSGHTVFMNPPYGRKQKDWIEKAFQEGEKTGTTVVALVPARTDTKAWHNYCMKATEIRFIKGRLKFGQGAIKTKSAPFPSAVVVFSGSPPPKVTAMERQ
jgi:site-specific DNA-methyltransferase (adenine-specific)